MATSAALIRRTPSVMSPTLFAFEDHFSFETVIGRSPLSEVYRARHRRTGELFAVKRSVRKFRSKADRDRYASVLHALKSPFSEDLTLLSLADSSVLYLPGHCMRFKRWHLFQVTQMLSLSIGLGSRMAISTSRWISLRMAA